MAQLPLEKGEMSRRQFLGLSGLASAAMLAQALPVSVSAATSGASKSVRKYPIGLELYSVRTELARDLPGTLSTVAKMGYQVAEFYAPYFEWTPTKAKEVRRMMDDLGLQCRSTHNHIEAFTSGEGIAHAIALNQAIGAKYLIMASAPKTVAGVDGWKQLCAQLSGAVDQLRQHGLTAGYHNHQAEWVLIDGDKRIIDLIAANTPHDFALQFDVGTCLEAGADPIAWIKANPGRIKSVHLKDWAPGSEKDEKRYRVLFGEGVAPWKDIVSAAESVGGVEYYLLEQEGSRYSEFETAQRCLDNWKRFRKSDA